MKLLELKEIIDKLVSEGYGDFDVVVDEAHKLNGVEVSETEDRQIDIY